MFKNGIYRKKGIQFVFLYINKNIKNHKYRTYRKYQSSNSEERIYLVKKMHQLNNRTLVKRSWRTQFKNNNAPADPTINNLMKKLNHMGKVNDIPPK